MRSSFLQTSLSILVLDGFSLRTLALNARRHQTASVASHALVGRDPDQASPMGSFYFGTERECFGLASPMVSSFLQTGCAECEQASPMGAWPAQLSLRCSWFDSCSVDGTAGSDELFLGIDFLDS